MKKENEKNYDTSYAEGVVAILAVLNNRSRKVEKIYLSNEKKLATDSRVRAVRAIARDNGIPFEICTEDFILEKAQGTTHGGLIAKVGDRITLTADELFNKKEGFFFILDGLEDPYNFGYSIRSLWAAGADGMLVGQRSFINAAGVTIKASAGTSEMIPCAMYKERSHIVKLAKKAGYRIVVASETAEETFDSVNLKRPLFLVIGGEKRGIAQEFYDAADIKAKIAYGREFPMSLTAEAAASVIAFEVLRQNRHI